MARQIFRKVALERMASPEQLDQMITITTPLGWLALFAIGALLLAAIFWGLYGSIPTQVQGQGILLEKAGLSGIQAEHGGTVTAIYVEVGDIIEKGEIIARLRQDDLIEQIKKAQFELENLRTAFLEKNRNLSEESTLQLQRLQKQELNQRQTIKNLEVRLQQQKALRREKTAFKNSLENLVKDGILAKSKVLDAEHEINEIIHSINEIQLEIERAKNQLKTIRLEETQLQNTSDSEQLSQTQQVEAMKLTIANLKRQFATNSQIISQYSGEVLEVSVKEGNLIGAGTTVVLVEQGRGNTELEALVYFSPMDGKQIHEGMRAQISPSTVKQEEFGFIEGTVRQVDEYPSTLQRVLQTLQNDALVQLLTSNAAPIKVSVNLRADLATTSGYKWSSRQGPPIRVDSNTICTGKVTIREQAPITLVIPILKKFLLGIGEDTP